MSTENSVRYDDDDDDHQGTSFTSSPTSRDRHVGSFSILSSNPSRKSRSPVQVPRDVSQEEDDTKQKRTFPYLKPPPKTFNDRGTFEDRRQAALAKRRELHAEQSARTEEKLSWLKRDAEEASGASNETDLEKQQAERARQWLAHVLLARHFQKTWQPHAELAVAGHNMKFYLLPICALYVVRMRKRRLLRIAMDPTKTPNPVRAPTVDEIRLSSPVMSRWPKDALQAVVDNLQPKYFMANNTPILKGEPSHMSDVYFIAKGTVAVDSQAAVVQMKAPKGLPQHQSRRPSSYNSAQSNNHPDKPPAQQPMARWLSDPGAGTPGSRRPSSQPPPQQEPSYCPSPTASTEEGLDDTFRTQISLPTQDGTANSQEASTPHTSIQITNLDGPAAFIAANKEREQYASPDGRMRLGPGRMFGEISTFVGEVHRHSFQCETDCVFFMLPAKKFIQITHQLQPFVFNEVSQLCKGHMRNRILQKPSIQQLRESDPVFATWPDDALAAVLDTAIPAVGRRGERIIRENSSTQKLFYLVSGKIALRAMFQKAVQVINPGATIGTQSICWMTLPPKEAGNDELGAEALTFVEMWMFARSEIQGIIRRFYLDDRIIHHAERLLLPVVGQCDAHVLKQVPVFAHLSDKIAAKITETMRLRVLLPETVLYREDGDLESALLVVWGTLQQIQTDYTRLQDGKPTYRVVKEFTPGMTYGLAECLVEWANAERTLKSTNSALILTTRKEYILDAIEPAGKIVVNSVISKAHDLVSRARGRVNRNPDAKAMVINKNEIIAQAQARCVERIKETQAKQAEEERIKREAEMPEMRRETKARLRAFAVRTEELHRLAVEHRVFTCLKKQIFGGRRNSHDVLVNDYFQMPVDPFDPVYEEELQPGETQKPVRRHFTYPKPKALHEVKDQLTKMEAKREEKILQAQKLYEAEVAKRKRLGWTQKQIPPFQHNVPLLGFEPLDGDEPHETRMVDRNELGLVFFSVAEDGSVFLVDSSDPTALEDPIQRSPSSVLGTKNDADARSNTSLPTPTKGIAIISRTPSHASDSNESSLAQSARRSDNQTEENSTRDKNRHPHQQGSLTSRIKASTPPWFMEPEKKAPPCATIPRPPPKASLEAINGHAGRKLHDWQRPFELLHSLTSSEETEAQRLKREEAERLEKEKEDAEKAKGSPALHIPTTSMLCTRQMVGAGTASTIGSVVCQPQMGLTDRTRSPPPLQVPSPTNYGPGSPLAQSAEGGVGFSPSARDEAQEAADAALRAEERVRQLKSQMSRQAKKDRHMGAERMKPREHAQGCVHPSGQARPKIKRAPLKGFSMGDGM